MKRPSDRDRKSMAIQGEISYRIRVIFVISLLRPLAIGQFINIQVATSTSHGKKITIGGKGEGIHLILSSELQKEFIHYAPNKTILSIFH